MRILVTMLMAIGDGIYATAALSSLKKAWPESKITVLVSGALIDIVKDNPLVDNYIVDKTGTICGLLKNAGQLRKGKFNLGICFDGRTRTLSTMWLAGVKDIVYVDGMYSRSKPIKRLLSSRSVKRDDVVTCEHVVVQYKHIIEKITCVSGSDEVNVGALTRQNRQRAADLLDKLPDGSGSIVAVSAKSSTAAKNWDSAKLSAVLRESVARYGIRPYFVGSGADLEYSQQIIEKSGIQAANFCGQTSLKDLVALFQKTDLFLGVCTGTAHLAACAKLPCVMIYTCSPFRTWYPYATDFMPVCSFENCATGFCDSSRCAEYKCVDNLDSKAVLDAVDYMLKKYRNED